MVTFYVFPDAEVDPVAIYDLYISKLNPLRPDLFQKPRKFVRGDEANWFENQVIGRDPLNNMMKEISTDVKLSKIYTNHSVRATCLTKLDESGFEIRHIQAVSGHKSEESIKSYSRRCPERKKKEMARALDTAFTGNEASTSSTSGNQQAMKKNPTDIVDFVPIPNNEQEFNLGKIIGEVSKEELIKTLETLEKDEQASTNDENPQENTTPQTAIEHDKEPQQAPAPQSIATNVPNIVDVENAITPSQNVVNNVSNQNYPILPRMIFNNSSVTINYNIINK